jgi:hypothetical protein
MRVAILSQMRISDTMVNKVQESDLNLIYSEIDIKKLQFGVNRPESWWDKHPNYKEFQKTIIQSIMRNGLKNPLSAENQNDDGFFVVTVGNQRLQALKTINVKTAPCVIAYSDGQNHIPAGKKINDMQALKKLFSVPLKKVVWNHSTFHATPSDVDEWDADKILKNGMTHNKR